MAAVAAFPDWYEGHESLRTAGYYASGFAFVDPAGNRTEEWLTVRVADGSYISISLADGHALVGAYDQLVTEATGGPSFNPGEDLSDFLLPAYLVSLDGRVMSRSANVVWASSSRQLNILRK